MRSIELFFVSIGVAWFLLVLCALNRQTHKLRNGGQDIAARRWHIVEVRRCDQVAQVELKDNLGMTFTETVTATHLVGLSHSRAGQRIRFQPLDTPACDCEYQTSFCYTSATTL